MTFGLQAFTASSVLTFDSSAEYTLFLIDERSISGNSVGTGLTITYPSYAGHKIVANLTSPYQNGSIDGYAVLSCRISYNSGVPQVTVFIDNNNNGIPVCDGYLLVFDSGAAQ